MSVTVEERRALGREKAEAALERIDQAVAEICESDEAFREYLRVSGRMHGYSWGNRLLVWLQRPDAGMVAGYKRWAELGRPVCKGSKGLQILAPMVKVRSYPGRAGEMVMIGDRAYRVGADGKVRVVMGFRVAYVFSVHDTDGPELATPEVRPITDDSAESQERYQRVLAAAGAFGFTVDVVSDVERLGDGNGLPAGWANLARREITLNADLPAGARFKVLAHEVAHLLAEHDLNDDSRRDAEAVAEGATFVVAAHYGMDTAAYSAPYIAGWAQDVERLRRLLDRVAKIAGRIIDQAGELDCQAVAA